jgi:NAD+ kinase
MPIDHRNLSAKSPCFVHSHLDKGASLQDWLEVHAKDNEVPGSDVGVAKALQQYHRPPHHVELPCPDGGSHALSENDDSDTYGGSLTKQLAETAVGVREMSKQLGECSYSQPFHPLSSFSGRARIRSNIQSVLIVTKARDNRLIKLTRELALYLMLKHRQGSRGLVV